MLSLICQNLKRYIIIALRNLKVGYITMTVSVWGSFVISRLKLVVAYVPAPRILWYSKIDKDYVTMTTLLSVIG